MRAIGRRHALWLIALLLTRCGGAPPPPAPPTLDLSVEAGADQNPVSGSPTSVAIRLYQLAAPGAFESADVFALTDREAQTLGADDLGSQEFVLSPGEQRVVQTPLKPGAAFLGAVALFYDIDQAHWRALAPLASNGASRLLLTTSGITLTLRATQPGKAHRA